MDFLSKQGWDKVKQMWAEQMLGPDSNLAEKQIYKDLSEFQPQSASVEGLQKLAAQNVNTATIGETGWAIARFVYIYKVHSSLSIVQKAGNFSNQAQLFTNFHRLIIWLIFLYQHKLFLFSRTRAKGQLPQLAKEKLVQLFEIGAEDASNKAIFIKTLLCHEIFFYAIFSGDARDSCRASTEVVASKSRVMAHCSTGKQSSRACFYLLCAGRSSFCYCYCCCVLLFDFFPCKLSLVLNPDYFVSQVTQVTSPLVTGQKFLLSLSPQEGNWRKSCASARGARSGRARGRRGPTRYSFQKSISHFYWLIKIINWQKYSLPCSF